MSYPLLPPGDRPRRNGEPPMPQLPPHRYTDYPVYPANADYSGYPEASGYFPQAAAPVPPSSFFSMAVAWRNKWTILFLAILGGVAGYGYAWSQRPVYQAKLIMEVQSANENFMNLKDVDPTSGGNSAESLQTQLKILQSDSLFARVRKSMEMWAPQMRSVAPTPPHPLLKDFPAFRAVTFNEELAAAPDNLKVRVNGLSRLVELRFDSADPRFAAEFLNRLVEDRKSVV